MHMPWLLLPLFSVVSHSPCIYNILYMDYYILFNWTLPRRHMCLAGNHSRMKSNVTENCYPIRLFCRSPTTDSSSCWIAIMWTSSRWSSLAPVRRSRRTSAGRGRRGTPPRGRRCGEGAPIDPALHRWAGALPCGRQGGEGGAPPATVPMRGMSCQAELGRLSARRQEKEIYLSDIYDP
jgi:hypothetical protein